MTIKNKIAGLFWGSLFLIVVIQLSSSGVIPLVPAILFGASLVATLWLYIHYVVSKNVKRFLTRAHPLLWLFIIASLSLMLAFVLTIEAYVIIHFTIPPDLANEITHDSVSNFFGFFMITAFVTVLNYLFEKYKDYLEKEKELESLKRKSLEMEINLLRNQMSPHFTFNILNNLQFLIRKDKEDALRLLERYSKILRYYVYESQKEFIPLEKEVAFLKEYFNLEINRHVADLLITTDWDIPESNYRIAPFILSTFVENAFKHVLPNIHNEYYIKQTCFIQEGDKLIFEIVNSLDETVASAKPRGIGLRHVRERLKLLYPDRHTITLSETDLHFVARLELTLSK